MALRARSSKLYLAGQVIVYGTLGTASSAVVYLLHEEIRQVHRMRSLFVDGGRRRQFCELARKHGVNLRIIVDGDRQQLKLERDGTTSRGQGKSENEGFNKSKPGTRMTTAKNEKGTRRSLKSDFVRISWASDSGPIRHAHQRLDSRRSFSAYPTCWQTRAALFGKNARNTNLLQKSRNITVPALAPTDAAAYFLAGVEDSRSIQAQGSVAMLCRLIKSGRLSMKYVIGALRELGAHHNVVTLVSEYDRWDCQKVGEVQGEIFDSFVNASKSSKNEIPYAFSKILPFIDVMGFVDFFEANGSSYLGEAILGVGLTFDPDYQYILYTALKICRNVSEEMFIRIFDEAHKVRQRESSGTSNMQDLGPETGKLHRSQWVDSAIRLGFYEAINHMLRCFQEDMLAVERTKLFKGVLRSYAARGLDDETYDTLMTLLAAAPATTIKILIEEFKAVIKASSSISEIQRSTLAMAILTKIKTDTTEIQPGIRDSQVQSIIESWKADGNFEHCRVEINNCLQSYDTLEARQDFFHACMMACASSGEFGLSGRIALLLVQEFPLVQSDWEKMVDILTNIAAAGLLDALRTLIESLNKFGSVPGGRESKQQFLPVSYALVSNNSSKTSHSGLIHYFETTVSKYGLPIGPNAVMKLLEMTNQGWTDLWSLKDNVQRVLYLARLSGEAQKSSTRQAMITSAFYGLVNRSPNHADLHFRCFRRICAFDINLISKRMCAILVDSMTLGYFRAQDYVRKSSAVVGGFDWDVKSWQDLYKLKLDLGTGFVATISESVIEQSKIPVEEEWFQGIENTNAMPDKVLAECKIVAARMRQARASKASHRVIDIFSDFVDARGGQIPNYRSIYCMVIDTHLRRGEIGKAMAVRDRVATQGDLDIVSADFMLEKHHVWRETGSPDAFSKYREIIEKWRVLDNTETRKHYLGILVQVFLKLRNHWELEQGIELLRDIYHTEAASNSYVKLKLLKMFLATYSKALDVRGVIWTVSTAIRDGVELDWDLRALIATNLKLFAKEFKKRAESTERSIQDGTDEIQDIVSRERAHAISTLVWSTMARLRKMVTKAHKRQRAELESASRAIINMFAQEMFESGTMVRRPREFLESAKQVSPDVDLDKDVIEAEEDATLIASGDVLDTSLSNPHRGENVTILKARKRYLEQVIGGVDRKQARQIRYMEKYYPSLLLDTDELSLVQKLSNFAHIEADIMETSLEVLAGRMMEDVGDKIRDIMRELKDGPSTEHLKSVLEIEEDGSPPKLTSTMRPVQRKYALEKTKSPWGSESPVKSSKAIELNVKGGQFAMEHNSNNSMMRLRQLADGTAP